MCQLMTESIVLAALGGAVGALLATWGTTLMAVNGPPTIPRLAGIAVNTPVLLYAVAISVLTGVVFGMAPARMLVVRGLHGTRVTATSWRYRASLIAVNVALSVLLLVGAGLLVRSFTRLLSIEPGFEPSGVLTFQVDLSGEKYGNPAAVATFFHDLSTRLASTSRVDHVGASTQIPLTGSRDRWGVTIEGRHLENPADAPEADRYGITPGYFSAMKIPLLRGRLFTEAHGLGAPPVVVIGKTMAAELWPGEDPIGRRVTLAGGPNDPPRTIVGIVDDVRH